MKTIFDYLKELGMVETDAPIPKTTVEIFNYVRDVTTFNDLQTIENLLFCLILDEAQNGHNTNN